MKAFGKEWFTNKTKRDILLLIFGGCSLIVSFFDIGHLPLDAAWVAIVLCGIPILKDAIVGLVTRFDIKADVLVSLALIASVIIGEIFAAGEVAFIMQIGSLLEELTVAKARAGIEKLVHLTPRIARRIVDGKEEIIPAEGVAVNDRLRVLAGETIPVDGIILSGQTSVNQAVMTGESLPVDKQPGDDVFSGTVNQFGTFEMQATRVGEDSSIQRMIRLVQSADAGKAKIVSLADRWATWIVVAALSASVLTWIFTHEIIRAVTILVVFCPCALVLATPTAIMAAIGNATKHGFLVREGDALERLAGTQKVTFDKTGTLTYGKPEVVGIQSGGVWTDCEVYRYTAAAEQRSEHPLGKAIVECWKKSAKEELFAPESFQMIPGRGVSARICGKEVLCGSTEMLLEAQISIPEEAAKNAQVWCDQGCTVIYTAIDGKLAGFLALSDSVRTSAAETIHTLKQIGVQPVLLTGDHASAARHIAEELGICEYHAQCLPEDKLHWIDSYQKERQNVCMIGDGINDAPALKKAYVGIAMGGIGSDIAVEAADIALVNDEIRELPHLIRLSKRMMTTIRLNLIFSMTLNFIAVFLAIAGILNPVVGALVHNAGSVLVIINSALLLKWHKRM